MADIIEVRDNGIPVSITKDNYTGRFTLKQFPYGTITASVQGLQTTASDIVKDILQNYGPTHSRISAGNIDNTAFNNLNTQAPYRVGVYLPNTVKKIQICQEILASVGASLYCNNYGKYTVVRLDLENLSPTLTITDNDIFSGALNISAEIPVKGAFNIAYCKNWTVLSTIAESLAENTKDIFRTEWKKVKYVNTSVVTEAQLSDEPEQINTYLLTQASAEAESQRLVNIWSKQRYIVSIKCFPKLMFTQIGTHVTINSSMLGFSTSKSGIVVGAARDWIDGTITLEVLI